ncbi:MAG: DUF1566 domain-containing protein [SAR324 cluster bacterium]|nr:DUF1566 domain-containing protein [SAR324 cluster bacterium]
MKKYTLWMLFLIVSASILAAPFTENGNGTVTDSATGLVWQQSNSVQNNWEKSLNYCEALTLSGQSDWRMPNRNELQSIMDFSKSDITIDTNYFPSGQSDTYWSSTTETTSYRFVVNFGRYYFITGYETSSPDIAVRCVRGGQ